DPSTFGGLSRDISQAIPQISRSEPIVSDPAGCASRYWCRFSTFSKWHDSCVTPHSSAGAVARLVRVHASLRARAEDLRPRRCWSRRPVERRSRGEATQASCAPRRLRGPVTGRAAEQDRRSHPKERITGMVTERTRPERSGFTLIELLVVIAIIAVLIAL